MSGESFNLSEGKKGRKKHAPRDYKKGVNAGKGMEEGRGEEIEWRKK